MDFWLYWITIALGSAIGVAVFWIVWWFFLGGKEDEMKFQQKEERKRRIVTRIKRMNEYEYEVIVNDKSYILDLDKVLELLSTPEDR